MYYTNFYIHTSISFLDKSAKTSWDLTGTALRIEIMTMQLEDLWVLTL